MANSLVIKNCRLLGSNAADSLNTIHVEDGIIASVRPGDAVARDVLDAGGRTAVPGFIDLHIQGAGGCDLLDGTLESLQTISKTLARFGTTSFLGTTVVKPGEGNRHLKIARAAMDTDLGGASLLGIHLEGPFINEKKRGGIDTASIYPSTSSGLVEIFDGTGDSLKMMTIAPELRGNLDIIRVLAARGVVPSFGHSDATYEETKEGFEAGISHVTHLFNAMPSLHHRTPGPLVAIFEEEAATLQIISDGHHVHPAIVRLIHRLAGPGRCVCITDGISGMGLPDGNYTYNGKAYESKNGAARYADGTLIGSTMPLGQIALKFREFTGCTLAEAIDSVTINPALTLGIEARKGRLAPGVDADIVLLDPDGSVITTIVGGKICYRVSTQGRP